SDLAPNTIYRLSKAVLAPSGYKVHGEFERLIYSLQGLINRDFGMDNKHTVLLMVERDGSDSSWQTQLTASGTIMNGMNEVKITTWDAFLTTFLPTIKKCGLILWDGNVPATSNVAATICGLDGYLPMLYNCPLYTVLINKGVTVKQNLVGQFVDGKKGTKISGTSVTSTGSAKNDAYLWALEKYFSRCSSKYLAYILDGAPTIRTYDAYEDHPAALLNNSYRACLANHDYLIARRCFFFDLAPYAGEAACDDPAQKSGQAAAGTDNATMLKIFQARYDRAGGTFGQLMGFPPWWVKYTSSDNMGSKAPTWIEWLFCEYITSYNLAKEADAAGTVDMTNGSLHYKFVPTKSTYTNTTSPCESVTYDKNTYYYTIYMGDYDSSAWLKSAMYSMWLKSGGDKKRGTLPLMWSINPNLSDRVPVVFDYIYKNKTSKDYFAGGDGGAGYIIPEALFHDNVLAYSGVRRPYANGTSGGVFASYSKTYYQRFGMEMTGFIINGAHTTLSANVADCISRYSPKLNFTNCSDTFMARYGSTYFVYCHNGVETGQSDAMYSHAIRMMNAGINFGAYRTVVLSPTKINTIVTDFATYATEKGLKVKYVDPYTYYNLAKSSGKATNLGTATLPSTSSTPQTATQRPSSVVLSFDSVTDYTGKFSTDIAIETNEKKQGNGSMRLGFNAPTAQSGSNQVGGMVVHQFSSPVNMSSANVFKLDYWIPQAIVGSAALQVNFVTNGTDDGYNFVLDISNAQPGWHTLTFGKNGVTATANSPNWASISAIRITYFNYSNITQPNFMLLDNLTADATITIPDPAVKTVLLGFDSVTNFTGAFSTDLAIETNEKKEGSGSMRLGFNAPTAQSGSTQIGGMVYYKFPSAVNLSDAKKFTLNFYTPQSFSGSAGLQINFVTNGSDDGYNFTVGVNGATPGWNTITIDKNNPSATANSPNWSSIKAIRITYFNYCNSATPVFILLDNLVKIS
ncbi:MAG: hypothetical protein IKT68_04305, partial [Clostridia bacterium]|nr:hypothetical protein [Clostridia bacterium]